MGRSFYRATFTCLLAAVTSLGLADPARAGAIGSKPIDTFQYSVKGALITVPTGCFFTHIIRGKGRKITYQNAGVDCGFVAALGPGFCNWRIDFTYLDTNNRKYRTSRGRTHTKCKIDPMRNNAPQTLPRHGKACATLFVNGTSRVSQCHYITN